MRTNEQWTKRLRRVLRFLRKDFPTRRPVTVRILDEQPGLCGLCIIDEERALIRLTRDAEQVMIESLIEEWAHVLRHDTPMPIDNEHDGIFWAIYGAITLRYRGE